MTVLSDDLRAELLLRWSQPHRRHHDVVHLREVLDAVDLLAQDGVAFEREPVELAAWFHDAVYEIGRTDNEMQSAELARELLPPSIGGEVARLVLLTETHRAEPGDVNGAVLSDADLSVLGGSAERYSRYADAVREEYASIPDEVFRPERARVLGALLDNAALFHTEAGRARWDAAARRNVEAELRRLVV
jgi:predicted metal-dependent HD superfamily phosphohydrolase